MSIIHGSWIVNSGQNYFFIWGETWRSLVNQKFSLNKSGDFVHPFDLSKQEFLDLCQHHELEVSDLLEQSRWQTQLVGMPTIVTGTEDSKKIQPVYAGDIVKSEASLDLYLWEVKGFRLTPLQTVELLQILSFNSLQAKTDYLAGDICYWSHVYRWVLDLIVRQKFLPGIDIKNSRKAQSRSIWQPIIDSEVDRVRLAKFTQTIPEACLAYLDAEDSEADTTDEELLLRSLAILLDSRLRTWIDYQFPSGKESIVRPWLESLADSQSPKLDTNNRTIKRLSDAVYNWTLPISEYVVSLQNNKLGQNRYRVCFVLTPPAEITEDTVQSDWSLEYYLQALDDVDFVVNASIIWQCPNEFLHIGDRTIENPQEILLKGLGLATRLYSPIAESLEESQPMSCTLNPIQVYEFIRAIAWQLKDNGLGVILPPGLTQGNSEQRLGIKMTASVNQRKGQRLSLQSMLKYKLEIAIGDRNVSKRDFKKLLAQKSPIVEIGGQWIALQPADVKAAQAVLDKSNEQLDLSVEDALRLSTGDTKTLAKLPVVKFEPTGVLAGLLDNLTDNKAVEPVTKIQGFKGELRPYQAKGVGWLSFLETWGLGACLADDMGLGKCVLPDTKLQVNGVLESAEDIWQKYSQATQFDGEGYWSKPIQQLLVNSIDELTGKIIVTEIGNLYRQQVKEKVVKINLKDGSSITITKQHKLLTNNGWTNDLHVGDYVAVPKKLYGNKNEEDLALTKLLAWQIAEGWENNKRATANIFQKSTEILSDLHQIAINLAKKYNFEINQPKIRVPRHGRVPYLSINSKEYRKFLNLKGYQWGEKSRSKSIPRFIMEANLSTARVFLRNYFDAEASVDITSGVIEISSASSLLIQQLSILLRRFGIWLRITQKSKRATNGSQIFRDYYIGTMGGNAVRIFFKSIGFQDLLKQDKTKKICNKSSNTNVEGIPASQIVAEVVTHTKLPIRHLGMHNTVYIDGSQEFSNQSLTKVVSCLDNIISGYAEEDYKQLKPSRWTTSTLAAYQKLDKQYLASKRHELQNLLDSEILYCPIKSIEEIDYEGWVYDFEIPVHHNFVANNIICHNTIQLIGFLLNLKQQKLLTSPTLLVCPTSVINNWEREVKKFAPNLSTVIHHGDKREQGKNFAKQVAKQQLVITSYSLVARDLKTLSGIEWQGVVLDEAQNIKNPTAKQSQALRDLPAGFRIALTGTPVENKLTELWSILDFLNPGFLGNRNFFQKRFAAPIEKYGDRESLNILRSLTQPFILRRLKTDKNIIQDLPDKQEMNVYCGLSAEQAELYQQLVDNSLEEIEDSEGIKRRGLILTLLLRLKQLCNHPELIGDTKAKKLNIDSAEFSDRSGKLLRLEEMLEEVVDEGDRALIFTQFSEWGKILKPYLEQKLKGEVLFLYGSTPRLARQEMVDRFQNEPNGPKIFILSLKAGGTGLNLTRANHVFHVDRWWNPAVENQATDRAFRIGQKRNVQVHKFVCTGTLEERISDIIESKKELAEQTVNAGEQWLTDLDTNSLRSLLLLDRDAVINE
ncbi:MAG: SNF2-related protein [Cyanobacteria bacterium P01_G01_bin.19]